MSPPLLDGLQIEEDFEFQRRSWRVRLAGAGGAGPGVSRPVEGRLRGLAVYASLLVIFRLTGKRSLGQITTFDFVLLLIISEAVQNGMVGQSYSITTALVLVLTLVGVNLGLSLVKDRSVRLQKWIEGLPLILMDEGRLLHDRMKKARVDEGDILSAPRDRPGA
ncbi:MAG: hypothetical protein K6T92_00340 [Candidatus Rokubacteria bacterium]|nr:hypothetical protein [Candidatus Rokubacteria bacterium]